ncbi:MAG TPA: hypothetical protein VJX92_01560 [Methylomirabilota bacterium]|nr:hypothetical protein [Methylomirabilota bacterium]
MALLAVTGLLLGLGWSRARRGPVPIPVMRCPIHGIAYDTELEICPECAKTAAAGGQPRTPRGDV